jgi:hypothetical protein
MAGHSELQIAIAEAQQHRRERDQALLDLRRARMLLTTAKRLVDEERVEINQLRAQVRDLHLLELSELQRISGAFQKVEAENEMLRQQLWELSSIRSTQLGLEPRQRLRLFPAMEDT